MMKSLLLAVILLGTTALQAQKTDTLEGLFQGYDGEWQHASQQILELAEAFPAEKYAWRPAPGVRSTSEVFMHIVTANYYLLHIAGQEMPADLKEDTGKTTTDKAQVIAWLKRALEAVKTAHDGLKPADHDRKVQVAMLKREATVDGVYLRILVHANEHMGQLVAYARMNGVVPPWSDK